MEEASLATASAWSPDPKNPPLYLDLPTKNGVIQPDVLAKWTANAPLAFVDQYIGNLKRYTAIAIDVGDRDGLRIDARKLHDILDSSGLKTSFQAYSRPHVSNFSFPFPDPHTPLFRKRNR